MTVLVTGASGFLGLHCLRALAARGVPARAAVRDGRALERLLASEGVRDVPIEEVAIGREKLSTRATVDTVVHLAGMVRHTRAAPEEMVAFNVEGTKNAVRTAHALGAKVVFVSTSGTVGCFRFPDVVADEQAPFAEAIVGRWPYYLSKIRAEREGRLLAQKLGVPFVVVRPPVLLGPSDPKLRSSGHVLRVLERRVPVVPRGGMHFADVRDVSDALVTIAEQRAPRSVYHLPGTATSLRAFFRMVTEVSGVPVVARDLPPFVLSTAVGIGRLAPKASKPLGLDPVLLEMASCHWGLATLYAHDELGYRSRAPRQTLADTVAYLRSRTASASHAKHA